MFLLLSFKSRVLLPGQSQSVHVDKTDGTVVAVEPFEQNNNVSWPEPHLQSVENGKIQLTNSSNDTILLGKEVKLDDA